jgi:hypothetical protein
MPQTAWAMMATATSLSPCSSPPPHRPLSVAAPWANRKSATAEGSVKPAQAAAPPAQPARPRPSAKATWLLAGPGRN